MGEWHLSKYNIFSSISPSIIACFNSLKGSYCELSPEEVSNLYNLSDINKKFIETGMVVNFDEQEYLKSLVITKYNKKNESIKITIATTLACNFNCPYCFEKHYNNSVMTLEIQNKVVSFIKKIVSYSGKNKLHITWFGGEPLLALEVIENISKEVISFCEKKNVLYTASIITNGFLFTQEKVDILNKYKISNAQITLDGLEENHNKTRCLLNGKGTFEKILDNLKTVHYDGVVNIRNNICDENKQDSQILKKIIEIIRKQSGNIIIYKPAPIINNPADNNNKNQVNFLSIEDGIDFELKRKNNRIPQCKVNFCSASSLFFICIDSSGKLYKCWEDITFEERSYGDIEHWDIRQPFKTASNLDILLKYTNSAGILNDECKECNFLPICGGDCPSKKFFYNLKCPYTPFKKNSDYFIQKIREIVIKKNEQEKSRTN